MLLNKRILIIDDDPDILNIFKLYLKDTVSDVVTLQNPLEALEVLKFRQFDLIITDVLMPQLNGIELTKEILKHYPQMKIVVCSEGGSTGAKELVASIVMNKAISFGALYALKKPFKKAEITYAISMILQGKTPGQVN